MAASLAEELYNAMMGEPYNESPPGLNPDAGVDWDQIPTIRRIIGRSKDDSGRTDIQVMKFFTRQQKTKPTGMFELFSQYSGEEPDQIRENLIQYIYDNRENVEKWSKNCLPTDVSLSNWLLRMTHKKNAGDEFTLYLLCKIFNRHAVIITKTGLWTTLLNVSNDGELAVRA